jgi:hypothetical protein
MLYAFLLSPIRATYPAHYILIYLITGIVLHKEHKLRSTNDIYLIVMSGKEPH